MKKMFQKNLMASEDVQSLLGTGVFYANNAPASVEDGALVEIGDIMNHTVYTGLKDVNVRKITAPAAGAKRLAIVDYVGRSQGVIEGVVYMEGSKTAGLPVPEGKETRYRIPKREDSFWLGSGNMEGTPAVGKYLVPTEGSTAWTVADAAAESGLCAKIETTKNLTEGAVDTDILYFCTIIAE